VKTTLPFLNEQSSPIGDDGWALLAPFGDFPNLIRTGTAATLPVLQRIDKEAGEALVNSLHSFTGKAARFFRSIPIFHGHPDAAGFETKYPDATPRGAVADISVRDDGIYIRPALNEAGADLLNGDTKLGLSAYWDARQTGEVIDGISVWRPIRLRSVGLTPNANLPVPMLNDAAASADGDAPGSQRDSHPNTMDRTKLHAAIVAAGIASLANDAGEDALVAAIAELGKRAANVATLANEKQVADTALANARTEIDTLNGKLKDSETAFANERRARQETLIDTALQTGRITAAEKDLWNRRLNADFANESAALAGLEPKVKVASDAAASGSRREDGPPVKGRDRVIAAMERDPAINGTRK